MWGNPSCVRRSRCYSPALVQTNQSICVPILTGTHPPSKSRVVPKSTPAILSRDGTSHHYPQMISILPAHLLALQRSLQSDWTRVSLWEQNQLVPPTTSWRYCDHNSTRPFHALCAGRFAYCFVRVYRAITVVAALTKPIGIAAAVALPSRISGQ